MQCNTRREQDQIVCQCGRAWDVSDPAPPACKGPEWARADAARRRALATITKLFEEKPK